MDLQKDDKRRKMDIFEKVLFCSLILQSLAMTPFELETIIVGLCHGGKFQLLQIILESQSDANLNQAKETQFSLQNRYVRI